MLNVKNDVEAAAGGAVSANPGLTARQGAPSAPVYVKVDSAAAAGMIVLGFLFCEWFGAGVGLGVFAFTVLLCAVTLIYSVKARRGDAAVMRQAMDVDGAALSGRGGLRSKLGAHITLAVLLVLALGYLVFDITPARIFGIPFMMITYLYWNARANGRTLSPELDGLIVADLFNQWLIVPFSNIFCLFGALRSGFGKHKRGGEVLMAVLGLCICLPVLFVVASLLFRADDAFSAMARWFVGLFEALNIEDYQRYVIEFVLGIPVACYIFGSIYGNLRGRHTNIISGSGAESLMESFHAAPRALAYAPLAAFNLLYLAFFVSQAGYFLSAFADILPVSRTYSEYARKGFFELCAVAAINLALMAITYLVVKRDAGDKPKVLRLLTGALSVWTILLIVTALSKMFMYISSYGLTRLRFYSTWFMLLMLASFVIILLWHLRPMKVWKPLVISFVCFFIALSWCNADGRIASYNIGQYEQGLSEELDVGALAMLGDAAVPEMYGLYQSTDNEDLRRNLKLAILEGESYYAAIDHPDAFSGVDVNANLKFAAWNIQSWRAEQIRLLLQTSP